MLHRALLHNPVTSPRAMTLPDVSAECDTKQNCIAPGRRPRTCMSCILCPFEALASGSTVLIQGASLLALRSGRLILRSATQCSGQSEGSNRDYHAWWRKLDLRCTLRPRATGTNLARAAQYHLPNSWVMSSARTPWPSTAPGIQSSECKTRWVDRFRDIPGGAGFDFPVKRSRRRHRAF
ncbi:hypothetical protein FKP32DRAFT_1430785 [Trametes sanguinea]|nr:hypothetical protein FKP32DRAFT_1430785 [Trametes sanguinea]